MTVNYAIIFSSAPLLHRYFLFSKSAPEADCPKTTEHYHVSYQMSISFMEMNHFPLTPLASIHLPAQPARKKGSLRQPPDTP